MNVLKALEKKFGDPAVLLSSVSPGRVFRFATETFEDALKTDSFYLKLEAPELKDTSRIANLNDGKILVRDNCHKVIVHEASLTVEHV